MRTPAPRIARVGTRVALLILAAWANAAIARQEPRKPPAATSAEFEKLSQAYAEAEQKWFSGMGRAQKPDWSTYPAFEYIPRFKQLAEANAGKPDAYVALVWLIENPPPWVAMNLRNSTGGGDAPAVPADPNAPAKPKLADERAWALERFNRDHLSDPALSAEDAGFFQGLMFGLDKPTAVGLFEAILAKHPNREVKSRALFSMACALYNPFAMPAPGQVDPAEQEKQIEADQKRAGDLFKKLVAEYGDTKASKDAAPYLFEIEHLQVGMKAPDIEGTDIDGKPIKLSDFKGKVIVLDFWGFW